MPRYWLAKSEPDVYSIDDLARDGSTFWDCVRNYAARNNMMAMKKGDLAFFYHSNAEPSAIVGVMKVVKEAAPDPTQFVKGDYFDEKATRDEPRWFGVEFGFAEKFATPVTLADVKATPSLKAMQLVKLGRLSVCEVTPAEWRVVLQRGRKVPKKA